MAEAEKHYQEALTIRRDLAKTNPQVYQSDLVDTLGKLASLYFNQNQAEQARVGCAEHREAHHSR